MQIGELAEATGLSRDTLRFYEKRGFIRAHRRPNGYRHYPPETLPLLEFIAMAKSLGFTLAEIGEELPALAEAGISQERVSAIIQSRIAAIDDRIAGLQTMRERLAETLASVCPILAAQKQSADAQKPATSRQRAI